MRAFEYASPTTKEQVVSLLGSQWGEAEVLAGGTDLLALMKDDIVHPKRLVNLKEVRELRGITYSPGQGLRIGALATIQDLLDSAVVARSYRALAQAAEGITSPQIRNMGTVAGDLCQRPRCWYYRAGFGLFAKDEKGESLVKNGDNRYHAILGNSGPAYYVNPSSLAPALVAMGARVHVYGPQGAREIPAGRFYLTPSAEGEREYDLKPNEIVTAISVPPLGGMKNSTYEVRQREALDWPLAAASVVLRMSGNTVESARVVMGHVAPVPWRSTEAEQFLVGKSINEEVAQGAGNVAVLQAKSLSRNAYKVQLARTSVKRALLDAARGGGR
ncbi:MAG TPA: FAD binding domain-containing protein [Blastocatellia bacterium]|nr:FAD binding domain-containing protein [Blastocatellia bacterium]